MSVVGGRVGLASAAVLAAEIVLAQPAPSPDLLYGVTIDDLSKLEEILPSLDRLPIRPAVRVVFEPSVSAADYAAPVSALHRRAFVVGEILDSAYFPTTLDRYAARTKELLGALSPYVDAWEIANEINGEWLRNNQEGPESIAAEQEKKIGDMVRAAYELVKAANGKVMVTLFYNQDPAGRHCWAQPIDNWRTWSTSYLAPTVRANADYAMLSYYPDKDCPGLSPNWPRDFELLEQTFERAKVGFGEIGVSNVAASWRVQSALIRFYYGAAARAHATDARFVGGYFWWNYVDEMLPFETSRYWLLLSAIEEAQLNERASGRRGLAKHRGLSAVKPPPREVEMR